MEGLTGPAVKLTLYIKEGRGFGFLQNPIVIVARLCSNTLQTNIYPPVAEPQFHEELLWEVDKQTLRRLRTGKVPVKVECFTLTKQNQRSKVGTVLLDLRSAHIVAKGRSAHAAPDSWHKMQCGSGRCPEMLLCLRVEDMKTESQACGDIATLKSPRDSISTTGRSSLESDTLIQVGPVMMASDIFELTVRAESLENSASFKTSDVHFVCHAFGSESRSNPFNPDGIGECVISIRSSLHFLRQYLDNNALLWIKLEGIGSTQVDIASLVPTTSVAEFLELYADTNRAVVTHKDVSVGDLVFGVSVRLKHCQPETKELKVLTEKPKICRMEAAGDGEVEAPEIITIIDPKPTTSQNTNSQSTYSQNIVQETAGTELTHRLNVHETNQSLATLCPHPEFRSFSLRVELQSLVLHSRPIGRRLRFTVTHPQARGIVEGIGEIQAPSPGDITPLEDVAFRLNFVSTVDEIGGLMVAYPPKVSLQCASVGGWTALASAALETSRLLVERRRVVFPVPLMDSTQGHEIAVVYVALELSDNGTKQRREPCVGPSVLDERTAHEAVVELEEWKERQQETFKAQLSTKEAEHLEQLTAVFKRRCLERESQLELTLKQTSELADSLEVKVEACSAREAALVRAQAALEMRAEQLEQRFKAQVQMLRDASARMEDDLLHKAKLTENKCVELLAVQERLEKENALLKKTLEERNMELFGSQLTQEQTAAILQDMRLLEEKLDAAGRSKTYFKEQWRAVAQELHTLKTEHHARMQIEIRDSKQSIQQLGFQRLLNKEAEELDNDQKLLAQLKTELSKDLPPDEDPRRLNLSSVAVKSTSNQSEPRQLLHSLIDERDLLLRTGRFNLNDHAIDRINRQIRSQTSLL